MSKKHALFSPSSAKRWVTCPGSIRLQREHPEIKPRESAYAKEGTDAHKCLEILMEERRVSKKSLARAVIRAKTEFTKEMVKHAAETAAFLFDEHVQPGAIVQTETKVALPFISPDLFGTLDAGIVEEFGTLKVWDYKFGAGIPIEAEENLQLIVYALGLAHRFHYNFTDVTLGIIQPRAPHSAGPRRSWTISMDKLLEYVPRIKEAVDLALTPTAPCVPHEDCTRFCPVACVCEAVSSKALAQAKVDFGPVIPEIKDLSPEQIGRAMTAVDAIEGWVEAIRKRALEIAIVDGKTVPGFKVVHGRGSRVWTDPKKAEKAAERRFDEDAFERSLLTVAQFEKKFPDEKDFLKEHATNVAGKLTLVPLTDKRPPAKRDAKEEFTCLE